jgi:hypothetical protein
MNKKTYIEKYLFNLKDEKEGVNAMSISDISGIPRATVIRKLSLLIKKNYLNINDKKHYTIASKHKKELSLRQKANFICLSEFTSQIFNLMLIEEGGLK